MRACVRAYVRVCVRACVRAYVRVCVRACERERDTQDVIHYAWLCCAITATCLGVEPVDSRCTCHKDVRAL